MMNESKEDQNKKIEELNNELEVIFNLELGNKRKQK